LSDLEVRSGAVSLAGEESGERQGPAIVLLHGLTATRRYVVMGSTALQRGGMRVLAYDARGHGHSSPASGREYGYEYLVADLAAVVREAGDLPVILAGASMGAHTALRFALEHPGQVAGLALITPSFLPGEPSEKREPDRWDELARGLREEGVEGFVRAYDLESVPTRWRGTVETVLRQRLAAHDHPEAVADALEVVPRSSPFESLSQLSEVAVPTVVVASRDEADPGHPLAVGEAYAGAIPGAELVVEPSEDPPRSPIAWQGGQLSRVLLELAERTDTCT
jgi:3-oxoadipate enol-lactonase